MGRVHGWFLPPLRGGGERRGRAPRPGARFRGASGAGVARLELTVALTENSVKSGGSVNHRGRKGCSRGPTRGGRRLVRLSPHPGRGAVGCPQSAFIRTGRRSPRVIASYGQPLGPAQPFRAGPSTEGHATTDPPGKRSWSRSPPRPRREPRRGPSGSSPADERVPAATPVADRSSAPGARRERGPRDHSPESPPTTGPGCVHGVERQGDAPRTHPREPAEAGTTPLPHPAPHHPGGKSGVTLRAGPPTPLRRLPSGACARGRPRGRRSANACSGPPGGR